MDARGSNGVLFYRGLLVFAVAVLLVTMALFASTETESTRAAQASSSILEQLEELRPQTHEPSVMENLKSIDGSMPVEQVGAYEYVGSIAIPTLGVELPVAATTSDECLRESPCRYNGSYVYDDLIICGQGYRSHFGRLASVGIGDDVLFVAVDGTLYRYVVSNVETCGLEGIDAIVDDWDLTLFTFVDDSTCCVVRCIRDMNTRG